MKNILYATDCSAHDGNTLQYAYWLSSTLKATLTVLHVYSLPPITVSTIRPKKHVSKRVREEQIEILKRYCSYHLKDNRKGTTLELEVAENGSVSSGILSIADKLKPGLLIVGMKDEHTARGLFTGSIAKVLISKVATPLLIVPSSMQLQKIETMVYATDFEDADIEAITKMVEIAKPFEAVIKVVHVPSVNDYAVKDQMEWLEKTIHQKTSYRNFTFDTVFNDTVYEGLRSFLKSSKANMIALMEREESGFLKKLFHKDLVKQMESKITVPMLSFNAHGI